jgi:hypothetical protein
VVATVDDGAEEFISRNLSVKLECLRVDFGCGKRHRQQSARSAFVRAELSESKFGRGVQARACWGELTVLICP